MNSLALSNFSETAESFFHNVTIYFFIIYRIHTNMIWLKLYLLFKKCFMNDKTCF